MYHQHISRSAEVPFPSVSHNFLIFKMGLVIVIQLYLPLRSTVGKSALLLPGYCWLRSFPLTVNLQESLYKIDLAQINPQYPVRDLPLFLHLNRKGL